MNMSVKLNKGCGLFGCRPRWLQSFARGAVVVALMIGIRFTNKVSESYLSATLSTTERHFGFKTKEMSLVIAANDITAVFLTLPLIFYLNKKHKAFWCGIGQLIAALANLLPLLSFILVPSNYVKKDIDINNNVEFCVMDSVSEDNSYCEQNKIDRDFGKYFALSCFFLCKLCSGIAQQAYWTIGLAYMDDNVRNTSAPAVLGGCYMAGYIGGFAGKMLGSACLNIKFGNDDELGAWWLGWPLIAAWHSLLAFLFTLLPYQIKNIKEEGTAADIELSDKTKTAVENDNFESFPRQLWSDLKRLAKNKILIFDSFAMSFYLFAGSNRSYISKYIEFQFLTTPAAASIFSGSSTMGGMIAALAVSIVIITWFKPSARLLAGFNFFVDILAVLTAASFIFVNCDHKGIAKPGTSDCFSSCGCSSSYKPVCDIESAQTYFSVCAAGCTGNNITSFIGCSCTESGSGTVVSGYCETDCMTPLMAFLIIQFILNLVSGLGRVGNLLVHVRCVEEKDKALGMAIQEVFLALIAFIPGEIMFGSLVDSACMLWSDTGCGSTGYCLDYDLPNLKQKLFGASAIGFLFASFFDGLVWHGVGNLKIY